MGRRQVGQIESSFGNSTGATLESEIFSGNGSQTVFTLADTGGVPFLVDVGGQTMRPGTDYTVAGNVVTMAFAVDTDDQSVVVHYSTGVTVTTDPLGRASLDTSGAIVMNMENLKQKMFLGSAPISTDKTWSMINKVNALKFTDFVEFVGTPVQTFPDDWVMNDSGWELAGEKKWTPGGAGKYKIKGEFDGTEWQIEIFGPNA
jgi:hypothetical protein